MSDPVRLTYRLHEIEGELAVLRRVAERQRHDLASLQQHLPPVPAWHWTDALGAAALVGLLCTWRARNRWMRRRAGLGRTQGVG